MSIGGFGLSTWNLMRFEVSQWALFAAPASDWLRRGYLPDRLAVIGPRETMACVNSPRALARLTRTLFSLSARSLLRQPPLGWCVITHALAGAV